MNLRHWQHFLAIAHGGSFSAASASTGIAQPVLSREMRELEGVMGSALLQRHSRGVRLTAAGELFRRRAETLLQQIELLPAEVKATADEPSGSLAVGFPPSMMGILTGAAVAEFRARYPAVRLEAREATAIQIRDALLARDIDVGVITFPLVEPELAMAPLMSEPLMLVGPAPLPFDRGKPLTIAEVAPLPLVLAKRPNSTRILVEHTLQERGGVPNLALETDAAPIIEFVRRRIGYAILPRCYMTGRALPGTDFMPIDGLRITWAIGTARHRETSVAAARMIEIIRARIRDHCAQNDAGAAFLAGDDGSRDDLG